MVEHTAGLQTADIILAEFGGQAWLVRGEQHIDDLLGNTLDPHVSIEVMACESKSAVDTLWAEGGNGDPAFMWMIHPAIVNRARGQTNALVVQFAPWSAALDRAALRVVASAAVMAGQRPDHQLALVRTVPDGAPAMAGEMANLRCALLETELAREGLEASRMTRDTTEGGEVDLIALVLRAPPPVPRLT